MKLSRKRILKAALLLVLALLVVLLTGCSMNNLRFEKYSKDAPLIAVSDGLFSTDARNFFQELCKEENIPYAGTNNFAWFRNKSAIAKAHEQKREIILVGYSDGCGKVLSEARWCNEEGISVHLVYFDPTYLSYLSGDKIPVNVVDVIVYLSERNIFDILAIGKGRGVKPFDLENPNTQYSNYELRGPHIGIFSNNRQRLEVELKKIFRNHKENHRRLASL